MATPKDLERETTQARSQNIQDHVIESVTSNYEPAQLGFVSIRNEDGTQWYSTTGMWGPKKARRPIMYVEYQVLEVKKQQSIKDNSPDNGYFGLMNLKFCPCSKEEAIAAEESANKFDQEADDMPTYPNTHIQIPTLAELNELAASDVCLLIARCLQTSDLTFMYSLLKPRTLEDLVKVFTDLSELDKELIQLTWTSSEVLEFNQYCREFLDEAQRQRQRDES